MQVDITARVCYNRYCIMIKRTRDTRLTFSAQGLVMFIRWHINDNPVFFHKINVYKIRRNEYTDHYDKIEEFIINRTNAPKTREIICGLAEKYKDMYFEVWNDGY